NAAEAVLKIDPESYADVVPALAGLLEARSSLNRALVADRLGDLGARARPALPALRLALGDRDGPVRRDVARAILKIDPEAHADALPAVAGLLESPDNLLRGSVAGQLGRLGARARPAVPALLRRLADPDEFVRKDARVALQKIDPAALSAYDREHPQEERP